MIKLTRGNFSGVEEILYGIECVWSNLKAVGVFHGFVHLEVSVGMPAIFEHDVVFLELFCHKRFKSRDSSFESPRWTACVRSNRLF